MDNVVTSLLVMQGDGHIDEQAGGYSDWEARGGELRELAAAYPDPSPAPTPVASPAPKPAAKPAARKLSYKEQRELDALPGLIESLEQRQAELETLAGGADFYQREHTEVERVLGDLTRVQEELDQAIERWAELEG